MADLSASTLDSWLERLSKVAGILLPVVIAAVGGMYTIQKDRSDEALRKQQEQRDTDQKTFDNTQKQYANLTALLPLLTSGKSTEVQVALEIYLSEAKVYQAPTDLQPTLRRLTDQFPEQAKLVQAATEAGQRQQVALCTANAEGIYLQVANDKVQLALGKALADQLGRAGISPSVQGVQRIDQGPHSTELRYYFSETNNMQADQIIAKLQQAGLANIHKVDLSKKYLKAGCPPPAVYELWIGTSSALVRR